MLVYPAVMEDNRSSVVYEWKEPGFEVKQADLNPTVTRQLSDVRQVTVPV